MDAVHEEKIMRPYPLKPCLLLSLSLIVFVSGTPHAVAQPQPQAQSQAQPQAQTQTADELDTMQQDIITLRNEFKQWLQKAEQDQETVQQHIGDKLTELIALIESGFPSYAERVEQATALQTAIEAYSAEIGTFEDTVGSIETTMNARLDQIETTLAELKVRGVPRRRGPAEPGGVPVPGATGTPEVTENVPSMQFPPGQLFRAAYGFYMDGDYDTAIAGFQKYLFDFPNTQLAGAAQYWIAESLVKVAEYDIALEEYERLITQYPNNDKLPDGYYGKASALLKLGRIDEAKQVLQYLVDHYQGSLAAKKAEERLQGMQ